MTMNFFIRLTAAVFLISLYAITAYAEVEITDFKVTTLGRNELQQVMLVTFFIEYKGECGLLVVEAEGVGRDGQAVTSAMITGECGGSRGSFTAELPIPFEKYDLITSWRMKSVSATPPR
jgi:hypothetical protein